jgi:predicted phosphohydrolase
MKVWAIGDLHLSGANPKPMEIFGEQWKNHDEKISTAWRDMVATDDLVIVAGDTSWAMKLHEAIIDLEWLAQLPGRKVLIRGNHDYWWNSLSKMRHVAPESIEFIHNSAVRMNNVVIAGSRGWMLPPIGEKGREKQKKRGKGEPFFSPLHLSVGEGVESGDWTENDEKILAREIGRLTLSLDAAQKLSDLDCTLFVAIHYPPIYPDGTDSPFTKLIEQYEPKAVVYGHLHVERQRNPDEVGGAVQSEGFEGQRGPTHYRLVSADYIGFQPVQIL